MEENKLLKFLQIVIRQIKKPSFWAGVALLFSAFKIHIDPDNIARYVEIFCEIVGPNAIIAGILEDHKNEAKR